MGETLTIKAALWDGSPVSESESRVQFLGSDAPYVVTLPARLYKDENKSILNDILDRVAESIGRVRRFGGKYPSSVQFKYEMPTI